MVWVSASSQSQIHLLDCVREPVNQSISTAAKIEAWLKTLLMIQMHKNNGKVMKKSFSKSAFPFFHRKPSILWERNHKNCNKTCWIPFLVQFSDPETGPRGSPGWQSASTSLHVPLSSLTPEKLRSSNEVRKAWNSAANLNQEDSRGFVIRITFVHGNTEMFKCSSLQNADSCRVNV